MIRARPSLASPGLLVLLALPIGWIVLASMTPDSRLFDPEAGAETWTLAHYRALFGERAFLIPVRNSIIVAGLTTAVVMCLAAPAAYALARLPVRGRHVLLAALLAVSMFPQISVIAPLFILLRGLGLIDTFAGLVLPHVTFTLPLAIWLLTGYVRQLPLEIEEAAMVDGASRLRALKDVVLPVAAPALASAAILTFLYSWNEFLFALSFTAGPDRQTVPVAIALMRGRYQVPWGEVLAAAVIATAPVAALVTVFQKRIVAGLTSGAVKG